MKQETRAQTLQRTATHCNTLQHTATQTHNKTKDQRTNTQTQQDKNKVQSN